MAIFTKVLQNKDTGKWAYVEYSDEDNKVFCVLGDKEFDTEMQAEDWAVEIREEEYKKSLEKYGKYQRIHVPGNFNPN